MKPLKRITILAVVLPLTFWAVAKVVTNPGTARAQGQTPVALLLNGDFSQKADGADVPNYWQFKRERDSRALFSLQATGARSAPAALSINVERGTARVMQTLPSVPLEPALLSGYAKAPATAQTVQGVLQVFSATDDEPMLTISIPVARSTDWKKFSRHLLLPRGATRAVLSFEINGPGDVWLDDVSIAPETQGTGTSPNDPGATGQ